MKVNSIIRNAGIVAVVLLYCTSAQADCPEHTICIGTNGANGKTQTAAIEAGTARLTELCMEAIRRDPVNCIPPPAKLEIPAADSANWNCETRTSVEATGEMVWDPVQNKLVPVMRDVTTYSCPAEGVVCAKCQATERKNNAVEQSSEASSQQIESIEGMF